MKRRDCVTTLLVSPLTTLLNNKKEQGQLYHELLDKEGNVICSKAIEKEIWVLEEDNKYLYKLSTNITHKNNTGKDGAIDFGQVRLDNSILIRLLVAPNFLLSKGGSFTIWNTPLPKVIYDSI